MKRLFFLFLLFVGISLLNSSKILILSVIIRCDPGQNTCNSGDTASCQCGGNIQCSQVDMSGGACYLWTGSCTACSQPVPTQTPKTCTGCTDGCGLGSYDSCTYVNRSCGSSGSCYVSSTTSYADSCGANFISGTAMCPTASNPYNPNQYSITCSPSAPTVTATAKCSAAGDPYINVNYSPNSGTYGNRNYDLRWRRTTPSNGSWQNVCSPPTSGSGIDYVINSNLLNDNTTYQIQVREHTDSGRNGPTNFGSVAVTTPICTPPTPTPTPIPTPNCNSGITCGACTLSSGTCGSGTKTCTYTTYSGGGACTQTSAPNQTCTIGCSTGSSCISNACVCNAPATPTGLEPSGTIATGTRNITWDPVAGVTTYALRVNDTSTLWAGDCGVNQYGGDICNNNVVGTSYSYNFQAGHSYSIWVHAVAACGVYSPTASTSVDVYTNVKGQVYIDYNGNGAKEINGQGGWTGPTEPGSAGVKVTLSNGQTDTTDSNGNYAITDVTPALSNVLRGTYTESIAVPNGYTLKYPIPYPPTVYAYSPNITQNFGIQPPPPVCNPNSLTAVPSTVYVGGSNSTLTAGPCVPGGGVPGSVTYTWSPVSPGNVANINSNVTAYTPPAAGSTYTQTVVYPSVQVCNPGALGVASACTNLGTSITVKPVFTVSGNVFVDQNKDGLQNGTDANYTGGITISPNPTGATVTYPTPGNYVVSNILGGQYTITYNGPPVGYQMTYPQTIPPPSFSIRVGNASTGGACLESSNSASCDANGNITALRYGITNSIPWIQTIGGDPYFGGGISNPIPPGATCGPYVSLQGGGGTPGIVYTGNGSASLGSGQASPNPYNWIVGGLTYREVYRLSTAGVIKTSYNYVNSIAQQSGITPTPLGTTECGAGGISNCALSGSLANGVYIANGLTINSMSQSNTFSANRDIVILVKGDLNINTEIHVPTTSTAFFTASGNINVSSGVGNSDITSLTANIEGYYSADRSFYVKSLDSTGKGLNCPTSDRRLNLAGSIVVNAALGGGSFVNQRDLCAENLQCPASTVIERPDFILNAPDFFKTTRRVWQEIAP